MSEESNIPPERPTYRAGRKPTAIRVYTVNQESRYLVVENVPALGLTKELLELFALYGTVEEYRYLDDYPCEEFTDVYWIKFKSLSQARAAKRKVDDHIFFSSHLRVRYGPEYEIIEDTRQKLLDRRYVISIKSNEQKKYEKINENKLTNFPKTRLTQLNYAQSTLTSQPAPVMYPQADQLAYYNYNNYYNYPYISAQNQEPPIPGVEYPTCSSLFSTINVIRQRINDASTVPTTSTDKDKGNVNQTSTDSSIKSTPIQKRRRI